MTAERSVRGTFWVAAVSVTAWNPIGPPPGATRGSPLVQSTGPGPAALITLSRPSLLTGTGQHAEVGASTRTEHGRRLHRAVGPAGLPDGLGERGEVVAAVLRRRELPLEADDLPAARRGEAVGVLVAEVVRVRLGLGGQRSDDGRRVGVDVGERGDRVLGAPGPRTPPHAQHVRDDSAWTRRGPPRRAHHRSLGGLGAPGGRGRGRRVGGRSGADAGRRDARARRVLRFTG